MGLLKAALCFTLVCNFVFMELNMFRSKFINSRFFAYVLGALVMQGCMSTDNQDTQESVHTIRADVPKNIIMVVADGMGPAYTTAYRNFKDDHTTPQVDPVVFDDMLVGNASTYPAAVSGYVTDSAAAATALASGIKSYNGAIGVDVNKQPVTSVLQQAKKQGMRTGIAVTSQIVHATPAAYIAHNESRKNYNALADSFFDLRIGDQFVADVMLGGGTDYFEREERDLVAAFIDNDYEYVDSYNKLATLPAGSNVLGLFAPVGLPPALDDKRRHRLSYLTKHAIKHLENDNGFFLLVEASQVDWAGHANDIASAMAEMDDLAVTMSFLKEYVKTHPDTLVVLTADHSTGGLSVGANGQYAWKPELLHNMQGSVQSIAKALANEENVALYVESQLGFNLDADDKKLLSGLAEVNDEMERWKRIKDFLDAKTHTGWTTGGHTGVDVEVFAFGAGYTQFIGQLDNTDIARHIFRFLAQHPTVLMQKNTSTTDEAPVSSAIVDDSTKNAEECNFKSDWRCQ